MISENNKKQLDDFPNTLIAFYNSVQNEINNYRNWEWKIAILYLFLTTGILGLITNQYLKSLFNHDLRVYLTIVQMGAIISSNYHLYLTHKNLTINRKLRRKLEILFGFHEEDKFYKGTILPPNWINQKYLYFIERKAFVFPLIIILLLYELFVIFVIWTV